MNESKIIDFFEDMKNFKEKQTKQKQRGLNDYNLLTTVLNAHDEVRLHSRVIGSFLDINGLHYQGSLFLEKFLSILDVKDFEFDIDNSKLVLEYNNIDLYLTDGQKHIIIENKVYAYDQENQIKRYIELIKEENGELVSSAIQKCTNMQCKSAPLCNTYLLEIFNNPASLFCFNL
ncbi:hypothetical protein LPB137_05195 [Poseidonibacter parvus]|uniref:PD-(D/E)XK nuclease superfamily protein n=1 Tax=Poseidonibacter parvus TaxID=1850254 RepID=A0A1P8KL81_9BACT|nr:PD-(D/E)XK nuclease family protein [Poseidonibacter parvus]APW65285.1 hypothetical protein LPB137_05195 [Poseidonibacter parvus]